MNDTGETHARADAATKRDNVETPRTGAETKGDGASLWRLFCAIELTPEIRARAAEHIAHLRASLPRLRATWERTDKLHITLKFFGNVEPSRAHALSLASERAAKHIAPFNLTIADTGAFPSNKSPRVLWLGVRDTSGHLARLHQLLEHECAAANFPRDDRPFHPHLTIARLRSPADARELAALHQQTNFPPLELPVNELVLMRSELGPQGSRYTALSHHRLALIERSLDCLNSVSLAWGKESKRFTLEPVGET